MTAPNNIPTMTDCPHCQHQLDNHEERILAVEKRQDATESKLDTIGRDIIAIRAEGNARAGAASAGYDTVASCLYWKQHYNTEQGAGQVDAEHISLFQQAIEV